MDKDQKFSFSSVLTEEQRNRIRGIRVTDGCGNDITSEIFAIGNDPFPDIDDTTLEQITKGFQKQ